MIGPAPCWLDDLVRLELRHPGIGTRATVIAVNAAGGWYFGPIDWWATLHLEFMPGWDAERRRRRLSDWHRIVSATPEWPGVTIMNDEWKGSSGLYGAQLALALDFHRIALIGIPLDNSGYHGGGTQAHDYAVFRKAWRNALPWLTGRVFSMSGFTAELLGTYGDT